MENEEQTPDIGPGENPGGGEDCTGEAAWGNPKPGPMSTQADNLPIRKMTLVGAVMGGRGGDRKDVHLTKLGQKQPKILGTTIRKGGKAKCKDISSKKKKKRKEI